MKNTLYRIILLRHAESEKNIKKIHGGNGEKLTDVGINQAKDIANIIKNRFNIGKFKIFASTSFHTRATAEVIAKELNIGVEKPIDFKPLYLGVADGLSEEEMKEKYPSEQKLFEKWRKREIDIKELKIKDMENYMIFWRRGEKFLSNIPQNSDSMLVCSNSLMILLANILKGNHPETTQKYRHLDIENCGMIVFKTIDFKFFTIDDNLTNVNLPSCNW